MEEILWNFKENLRKSRDEYLQKTIENDRKPYEMYRKCMETPTEKHKKIVEFLRNLIKSNGNIEIIYLQKRIENIRKPYEFYRKFEKSREDYLQKII